jgi:flagellar biogenesis protein FliO
MGDVSLLSLFARLAISLAVVLAVMALAGRALRSRAMPGSSKGRRKVAAIEVIARQGLGRNASVAMVKAGGKVLLLGVTEQHVNFLGEADEASILEDDGPGANWTAPTGSGPTADSSRTWKTMIDAARERTVRR